MGLNALLDMADQYVRVAAELNDPETKNRLLGRAERLVFQAEAILLACTQGSISTRMH